MSADEFEEDVETEFVDRDGVTWAIATLNNVVQRLFEFRVIDVLEFGPNGEWRYEYDGGESGEDDAVLRLLDQAGVTVVEREEARQQQAVERFSLIAEYDAISEIPELTDDEATEYELDADSEARHPRGIVRFTQEAADTEAAIDAPGLYSFSVDENAWVRLDEPSA